MGANDDKARARGWDLKAETAAIFRLVDRLGLRKQEVLQRIHVNIDRSKATPDEVGELLQLYLVNGLALPLASYLEHIAGALRYQLEAIDKVTASASADVVEGVRDDLRQARALVGMIAGDLAAAEARLGGGLPGLPGGRDLALPDYDDDDDNP